jgi:hypothetical protein
VATLEKRIGALEVAIDDNQGGYLDILPVMTVAEWDEIAPKQQAELIRETYEKNA